MYRQYAKWNMQQVLFVTRMKDNAIYQVKKVLKDNSRKRKVKGLIKEQIISIATKNNDGNEERLTLRRITYKTEDGRVMIFITNNMTLSATQIALIYKTRWMIELLFKQIKQNFPLRYFWGASENAIKTQIYCVLIAQLLMVVIRKKAEKKIF